MIKSALRNLILANDTAKSLIKGGVHAWELPDKYTLPALVIHRIAGPLPETLSHGGHKERYYITQEQINVIGLSEREIFEVAEAIEEALIIEPGTEKEVKVRDDLYIEVLNVFLMDRQDSRENQFLKEKEKRLIMEFECEWRKRYV